MRSRRAFGVRGVCSRCRTSRVIESGSKLHALQTLRAVRLRPCRVLESVLTAFSCGYLASVRADSPLRQLNPFLELRAEPGRFNGARAARVEFHLARGCPHPNLFFATPDKHL